MQVESLSKSIQVSGVKLVMEILFTNVDKKEMSGSFSNTPIVSHSFIVIGKGDFLNLIHW